MPNKQGTEKSNTTGPKSKEGECKFGQPSTFESQPYTSETYTSTITSEYQAPVERSTDDNFHLIIYIFPVVTTLILIISVGIIFNPNAEINYVQIYRFFEQELHEVHSRYSNQNIISWNIIRAAVKPIMEDDYPNQPAVILFFGMESAAKTINCLVKKVENIINKSFNATKSISIQGGEYENCQPSEAKERVDEILKQGFESMSRVAVLYNINKIPTEAMMILHSYCDNENAPYKDRAILLTVLAQRNEIKNNKRNLTSLDVEKYLEKIWSKQLHIDSISSLLSRVGNSIVIINSEPSEISQC